jgi:hypothetical protein
MIGTTTHNIAEKTYVQTFRLLFRHRHYVQFCDCAFELATGLVGGHNGTFRLKM